MALTLLILLNGMGYTLIQVHFYLDREQITALHCVNKDKPELQCEGKCELSKRLSNSKDQQENQAEITLEELSLTFLPKNQEKLGLFIPEENFEIVHTPIHKIPHSPDRGSDFFHPPQV